ncbi:DNA translocase SpoIIIE [Thermoflexales bacterium]|nr:DNA translocase SpoIIIE [Thermoflexales bacterium]
MAKTQEKNSKSKKNNGRSSRKGKETTRTRGKNKATKSQPRIQLTLDQKIDILGIVLIAIGGLTILSMISVQQGEVPRQWIGFLRDTFGLGFFVIPIVLLLLGLWLVLRKFEKTPRLTREQIAGLIVLFVIALISMGLIDRAAAGSIGTGLLGALTSALGQTGTVVLLAVGWLIAIVLLFDVTPSEIVTRIVRGLRHIKPALSRPPAAGTDWSHPATPEIHPGQPVDIVINTGRSNGNGGRGKAARSNGAGPAVTPASPQPEPTAPPNSRYAVTPRVRPDTPPSGMLGDQTMAKPLAHTPTAPTGTPQTAAPETSPTGPLFPHIIGLQQPWECPQVADIFESGEDGALSEDDLRENAHIIEDTLQAFGVEGKVIEVNRGPAITQFGVEPGFVQRGGKMTKVKVSKITALADDLALALAAKTIRIEAPVPGKNIVGIEVPNHEIATVALRDVIESEPFQKVKHKGALPIALGQDVSGQAIATDLATMPHLLIAGTTGSGKSVCVNAIIACLMSHFTPNELRLLMVDPKRVELTTYNGVPHLLAPVVVDLEKVTGVLNWVTREMDERYRKFSKSGSRNIDDYNTKIEENNAKAGAAPEPILPYIVVIIDELADLMMLAPDETEKTICRLAQMARATGIHLIIATQRPSVDVVTGLIKANFPARIAFSVASSIDSRVILDTTGAERLLGRGDMLYVAPEVGSPQRLQGCFVSDKEIHKLVRYWKSLNGTENASQLSGLTSGTAAKPPTQTSFFPDIQSEIEQANAAGEDDLLQRAIDVVQMQKKASISLLQRQLRIGYTRAARLIDQMEEKGIVGPVKEDSRWREVLVLGDDRYYSEET